MLIYTPLNLQYIHITTDIHCLQSCTLTSLPLPHHRQQNRQIQHRSSRSNHEQRNHPNKRPSPLTLVHRRPRDGELPSLQFETVSPITFLFSLPDLSPLPSSPATPTSISNTTPSPPRRATDMTIPACKSCNRTMMIWRECEVCVREKREDEEERERLERELRARRLRRENREIGRGEERDMR